ncbi:MAG: fumarylacetoacetate hydrolase family protein [Dehalococcoidales bacterium]|nr:fumarylacetoacetate hydrolase family protein [Dehalococcoidales bacterium]
MKIVRFQKENRILYGVLDGDKIQVIEGEPFGDIIPTDETCSTGDVKLLSPVMPSKVVAVGLNYRSHAEETKNPVPEVPIIFIKPPTTVIGPEDSIILPPDSTRVDYECELAIVIKKKARRVPVEKSTDHILGYTCFNDVTARDHQRDDVQWTRGKGHDTFGPLGPWIETDLDPSSLDINTLVNGETRQKGNTSDLIFPVPEIVRFITNVMTLLPGDVIATGTPAGIGRIHPGDTVEIKIDNIGTLRNYVEAWKE